MEEEVLEWIHLSDPDIGARELEVVATVMRSPRLSQGPMVEAFEAAFADWVGRNHAVATSSGTAAAWLALRALGIGPGDEVVAPSYSWHQVAHAITLSGARPVFADIDYWSGCLEPAKAAAKITPQTRAILAGNTNGHPAAWKPLRELAERHGMPLIEDSTEAIGSRYAGQVCGSFGDMALFDFSQPSALCCGEGGMIVTDDAELASELRYLRERRAEDRTSVSVGLRVPMQARLSDVSAAIGLAQLERLDGILARRKHVEAWYLAEMQSFEGIKPPYVGDDVDLVNWMVYIVHLGKRFTLSARNQIVEDLDTQAIEAASYSHPLHQQFFYAQQGWKRGQLPDTDRIGDRAIALPFHTHLDAEQVKFIVKTLKETSINIGAGVPIY